MQAEDLGLTNDFLYYCIVNAENVEWRSRKNFLECVEANSNNMKWRVVGWVSYKTVCKWGKMEGLKSGFVRGEEEEAKYWLLCRGGRFWYVRSFVY